MRVDTVGSRAVQLATLAFWPGSRFRLSNDAQGWQKRVRWQLRMDDPNPHTWRCWLNFQGGRPPYPEQVSAFSFRAIVYGLDRVHGSV